ncbi:hypothetical protein C0416_02030 [bacterium]|nr:hypothetical protein [bacterium]
MSIEEYKLIRSRRSTLSLYVDENADLVVRAPIRLDIKYIEKFIREKTSWIEKKVKFMGQRIEKKQRLDELVDKFSLLEVKKRAKGHLKERLDYLSEKHGYLFSKMALSSAKTRWGSCGYKNKINLNWKVMLAPPSAIDYLIVHELVHTKHKNHQKDFWRSVEAAHPSYREDRKWLKENSHLLSIDV